MSALDRYVNKDAAGRQLRERRVPAGWVQDEICTCIPSAHVHCWTLVCTCGANVDVVQNSTPRRLPEHVNVFAGQRCERSGQPAVPQLIVHYLYG